MTIEITMIDGDGNAEEISLEEYEKRGREKFFAWLKQVGGILGYNLEETAKLVNDISWFFCYDDGMTAEEAVAEARSKGVV